MKFLHLVIAILFSASTFSQDSTQSYPGDSTVTAQIIGKWKDQNSVITYEKTGEYRMEWVKGKSLKGKWESGKWEVKNKKLIFKPLKHNFHKIQNIKIPAQRYDIHYFNSNKMSYKLRGLLADPTTWVAEKLPG